VTLSEHARRNRDAWTAEAPAYAANAEGAWAQENVTWGVWEVPDADVHALPDVAGKDVVELGCGTGYISAWLARKGARVTGVDVTPAQLETARAMQAKFALEFALLEASAEDVPLPDGSFDLAVSEYGASIWADPYLWIPEASRLLRPGGELVFLVNGTIFVLAAQEQEIPPDEQLRRPYFGMHRFEWPDEASIDFHLGYGDWIRLLRANDFEVEDLIELQAPEGAPEHRHDALAGPEWARKWPSEEIWRARKSG
jgi:SAM-dependent methyltransferase